MSTKEFGGISKINLKASNMAAEWKNWLAQFKIFMTASNLDQESDGRKVALLLHHLGPESFHIFTAFNKSADEVKYNDLIKLFDGYFIPKVNLAMERHAFFTRKQNGGESIDDYVTVLKNLSLTCDFGTLREDLVKDIFICGISTNFQHIKERLLSEGAIQLDKAVTIAKSIEAARDNANQLDGIAMNVLVSRNKNQESFSKKCTKCGQVHKTKCPAENAMCHNCNKKGHYAKMCFSKKQQQTTVSNKNSRQKQYQQYGKKNT